MGSVLVLAAAGVQLSGGPNSPPPSAGRNVYGELVAQGHADLFITYCTNARPARAEQPSLRVVAMPAAVNVSADYGVAPIQGAGAPARRFIKYLLSVGAQAILARSGFAPP